MLIIAHIDPSHDTSWYTVGWIAPLPLELTAAVGMLEDPIKIEVPDDDVLYHVGRIGSHFVVMVVCPRMGIEPAATALTNIRRSFPNIKHILVNELIVKEHTLHPSAALLTAVNNLRSVYMQVYEDPGAEYDHLFEDSYLYTDRGRFSERKSDQPHIHYGNIGSANAVVRSSVKRNELHARYNIICFEMEAAGVMSDYQGLVIRGVCDYADSHKNK
ncbi:nucleoside phosphorylase domain-containing protein, partial [Pseudoneurospora amorphoporcata]